MIDIHCHILSGIDDGPTHENSSIEMAKQAANDGITAIIATPHYNKTYKNNKDTIIEKVASFNRLIEREGIPIQVYPGQEPRISEEFLENYEKGEILTINDDHRYILVELPFEHVPIYTGALLKEIQQKNIIPILVHPERNRMFRESPDKLFDFVNEGSLTQLTADSILGDFGEEIKKFSSELVEKNLVHFVASDAHNITNRRFRLKEAFEAIELGFGVEKRYLLQENAEIMLGGENIVKQQPNQASIKRN